VPFIHSQLGEAQARRNPGKLPCPFVLPYVFVVRKNSFALIEKKTPKVQSEKRFRALHFLKIFCGGVQRGEVCSGILKIRSFVVNEKPPIKRVRDAEKKISM
jgi:hypothetical protein